MKEKLKRNESRFVILFGCILGILFLVTACQKPPVSQITVSAAANLIPAFEEIGQQFEAETGINVIYNFGSSGNLAQQIEQGAPVDVFASADTDYVFRLEEGGHIIPQSNSVYAHGRLVLWSGDTNLVPERIVDLLQPQYERVAIANPQYAPYGVIAKAVLEANQIWEPIQPKLIMADDVRKTLTYAETGDVSVALVPLSLVVSLETGGYSLVSAGHHPPIRQSMGLVSASPRQPEGQQFIDFVLSETGQTILEKYGYEPADLQPAL